MKILFLLLICGVCGGAYVYLQQSENTTAYVTHKLSRGNITEYVTATGVINPLSTVNIGTQVSGTIKDIFVDYNSVVKKDQLLAQIDPALFEAKVTQTRAALNIALAQVDIVKNDISYYKKHLNRIKKLNKNKYATDKELEEAERNYGNAVAKLALQEATVEQTKALLNSAEIDLKYTRIVSPINGIVVSKEVEVGQTVAASFQTPTLFYLAEDLTQMEIRTSVTEADIAKIKEKQDVNFFVDAYPTDTFKGTVKQVRNRSLRDSNVVTYEVIIGIDNKDLKLKPGMTANVRITTAKKENVLLAPNKALRFYVRDENGEVIRYKDRGIWILKDGKPFRVKIKTLIYDEENTEIEADLKEGDEIILEKKDKKRDVKVRQ